MTSPFMYELNGITQIKRSTAFQKRMWCPNEKYKSNTKKSCKRPQDKSLQVQYIVRVAMKNKYPWRLRKSTRKLGILKSKGTAYTSYRSRSAMRSTNCAGIVWKQVSHFTMITATKIWVKQKIWKIRKRRVTAEEDNKRDRRTPDKEEGYIL